MTGSIVNGQTGYAEFHVPLTEGFFLSLKFLGVEILFNCMSLKFSNSLCSQRQGIWKQVSMFLGLNYSYMSFSEYAVWKKKITTRNKFEKFVVWDMQPGVRGGGKYDEPIVFGYYWL